MMMRWIVLTLGLTLSLFSYAGSSRVSIVYTGNLDGELEPCGCSAQGDLGGLLRQTTMIDQLRRKSPNLFLLSTGGFLRSEAAQDRLTGEYILKGIAAQRYDAVGLQWRDLVFGSAFIETATPETHVPWTASNWRGSGPPPVRHVRHGEVDLAFFNWLDPSQAPERTMQGDHALVTEDTTTLKQGLRQARTQGSLTVLATTLGLPEALERLPLADVDVLLVRAGYEVYGAPRFHGRTLVLEPGSRGMRLGRADFRWDARKGVRELRHRVIALPKSVANAPRLKAWYAEYNDRVRAAYAESVVLMKARQGAEAPYGGAQLCQSCHGPTHETWSASRHARALKSLKRVNKAFDPACLMCHTVGFSQPGGFIDEETTDHLANVQCESCHGPSKAHADSGGRQAVANAGWPRERVCAQCHTQPHSPGFQLDQYWPKIAHPRAAASSP